MASEHGLDEECWHFGGACTFYENRVDEQGKALFIEAEPNPPEGGNEPASLGLTDASPVERKEGIGPQKVVEICSYVPDPGSEAVSDRARRTLGPLLEIAFKSTRPKRVAILGLHCDEFFKGRINALKKTRANPVKCPVET